MVVKMKEDNPKVSIVIPVYNGANYLQEAIDSALAQTYANIEVIVINDGSDDQGKTEKISKSYGTKISYFYKENGGVSSALNLGLKQMTGNYFSWLSHDDLYYPEKTEKQIIYHKSLTNKSSIIFSHQDIIDRNGLIVKKTDKYEFIDKFLVYTLLYKRFISGCSLLIPRHAFDCTGYFSNKYKTVQDYDMWFRMINKGYTFKYLDIASGMTRIHNEQDSIKKEIWHRKEKSELLIDVQMSLSEDVWINKWDNKAIAYFKLAINHKKDLLDDVYKYNMKKGMQEMKKQSLSAVPVSIAYAMCAIFWSKYILMINPKTWRKRIYVWLNTHYKQVNL